METASDSQGQGAADAAVTRQLTSLAEAMEARDAELVMAHYSQDSTFLVTVDDAVLPVLGFGAGGRPEGIWHA